MRTKWFRPHLGIVLAVVAMPLLSVACGEGADADGDADGSADGDGDTSADGGDADVDGDAGVDGDADADSDADADAETPVSIGTLDVDCEVEFVLDESRTGDTLYMTSHFAHLVQSYGITGTVAGVDLTAYPEKMYFGSHHTIEPFLFLVQVSMTDAMQPTYSVKIQFDPDGAVEAGSTWTFGDTSQRVTAIVIRHLTLRDLCIMAYGWSGSLTFSSAEDATAIEGGSFSVAGAFDLVDPWAVVGLCEEMADTVPCCE